MIKRKHPITEAAKQEYRLWEEHAKPKGIPYNKWKNSPERNAAMLEHRAELNAQEWAKDAHAKADAGYHKAMRTLGVLLSKNPGRLENEGQG